MNREILISAPIKFPIIKPDNWDKWWDIWHKESTFLRKISSNHNSKTQPFWKGFDIYVKEGFDSSECLYKTKNVNCPELFPVLFNNLDKFPVDIYVMRVVSNMAKVLPHSDYNQPIVGIRTLLYDSNVRPNFYYQYEFSKKYQVLPDDSNTWMYNDHLSLHGADYYPEHNKLLIMYYGKIKYDVLDLNLQENLNHYKDYIIYVNSQ
jgi:hypothetical protein